MVRLGLGITARRILGVVVAVLGTATIAALFARAEIERLQRAERALAREELSAAETERGGAAIEPAHDALAAAATARVTSHIAGAALLCALATCLVAWVQERALRRRIRALIRRTEDFVAGREVEPTADPGADEVALLGRSLSFMTDHLATVVSRARERARRTAEQDVAQQIQLALLPASSEMRRRGLELAGVLRPTAECSGDFWSTYALDDDRTLVVIGGASGHGVEAAMVVAAAKAACDAVRTARGAAVEVSEILEAMNAAVFQQSRRRLIMTCAAAIIDVRRRQLVHANAGHPFAYLFGPGPGGEREFRTVTSRGNKLGDVRESRYDTRSTDLAAGDTLIWYSDGILRCENEAGEVLGEKQLRAAIRRAMGGDVAAARDRIVDDCLKACGAIPPRDDITLVIARITQEHAGDHGQD
jgi:serine phosphatase RsbU (regulator of sigma subunit)